MDCEPLQPRLDLLSLILNSRLHLAVDKPILDDPDQNASLRLAQFLVFSNANPC